MTAILVVAIIVLLVGAVSGATVSALGKERKSIESHKKILSVMEDLSHSSPEVAKNLHEEPSRTHVRSVRPIKEGLFASHLDEESPVPTATQGRVIGLHGDSYVVKEAMFDPATQQIPIVQSDLELDNQIPDNQINESPVQEDLGVSAQANGHGPRKLESVIDDDSPGPIYDNGRPAAFSSREPGVLDKPEGHLSKVAFMRVGPVIVAVGVAVVLVSAVVFDVATTSHPVKGNLGSTPSQKTTQSPTKAKKSSTTSTVLSKIVPVSSNSAGATYQVPAGTMTVVVSASAPSWVEQSNTAYGKLFFAQTMSAGQSQTFRSSGPIWIRTGNVRVLTITVDNLPVVFSAPPGTYNFSFTQS